jgi:Domain of unknown function (DUF4340)
MLKNNILNLILFIFIISLASVIYFSEEKSTELEKLSATDITDITSITIRHNQNTTILFKQKGISKQKDKHWQITQPVSIAANDFRIKSILKLINAPVHNKYSVNKIDLKKIGLDKPDTSIKLNDKTIAFGVTNPATNLRYVKLEDFVYTIEDVYYPLLSSSFGALVSLKLLPENSEITKLILINQTISRDDKGLWQSNIGISADNINKTIDHWKNDLAFGVHGYMQRNSLGKVFIYIKNQQQPISYLITDTDPWLILARPELGLEYHLDIEFYNKLIIPK